MDMRTEPSVIVGTITAFVTAAIGLLVAFGLDVTDDQKNAVLAMTAVLAPVIAGIIIRGKVFSPETVDDIMETPTSGPVRVDPSEWGVNRGKTGPTV